MSSLASLYNVPSTQEELSTWSFAHAAHHRDINRTILQLTGIVIPEYSLDPFELRDSGVWQDQHQVMHQDMDAVLGISGFNLVGADLSDPSILASWIFLQTTEHYQAAQILGIG